MNTQHNKKTLLIKIATVLALLAVCVPALASAAGSSFNVAGGSAQPGMLMSLSSDSGVVVPTTDQNDSSMIGVIATDDTDFNRQPGQVSVKSDGVANALVSTLDGDIRVGDRIKASSLAGIGSKATKSGWIVGVAQGSVDAKTTGAIRSTVNDSKGGKHQVYVASIPMVIKVTYFTVATPATTKSQAVPGTVQTIADKVAGKHVSELVLVLSFVLLLIGLFLAAIVVNSAIRNGFVAIGRQPLAKALLMRKIMQSFGMSALILVVVLLGAFMLLRFL